MKGREESELFCGRWRCRDVDGRTPEEEAKDENAMTALAERSLTFDWLELPTGCRAFGWQFVLRTILVVAKAIDPKSKRNPDKLCVELFPFCFLLSLSLSLCRQSASIDLLLVGGSSLLSHVFPTPSHCFHSKFKVFHHLDVL